MSKTNLEQKIMTALTADAATAADLAELVATTEVTISECEARAKREAENVVDPMLSTDPRQSQRASDDAAIEAGRLKTLLARLESRYREILHATARAKWKERFDDLEHQRNNLAAELKATYPKVVSQLVELFGRAGALDQKISQLNQSRVSGCKGQLLGVELVARGLDSFTRDSPSIVARDRLQLPDWIESNKFAWPPRDDEPFAVTVSGAVSSVHSRQRHSGDWHKALTAETEQRKLLEQQRLAEEEQHTAENKLAYERSLPR
jgi:hypothetical protein